MDRAVSGASVDDYLGSIIALAAQAREAHKRGDHDEVIDLLGDIRDDLDAVEKKVVQP
jgi:hypothetical protein